MNSEESNENNNSRIVLPAGEYADYLATLAGNIADERIKSREQKWRAFMGAILTALAVLGFANLSSIEEDISSKVALSVQTKLPIEVEKYIDANRSKILGDSLQKVNAEVESRIAFMQLYNASVELSKGGGFTSDQRDTAVALIAKVAKNNEIVNSPEFAGPIENIIDAFLGADQSLYIDKIENSLEERISKSRGITLSMVQHYGMRVTGSKEIKGNDKSLFDKYAQLAAEVFKSPEAAAPFQLAINYKQNANSKTEYGLGIIQDISNFPASDRNLFIEYIDNLRSGGFYKRKTGKIERIEALFVSVYEAYKDEIETIRETSANGSNEDNQLKQFMEMLREEN